jgi:hypothetical protein
MEKQKPTDDLKDGLYRLKSIVIQKPTKGILREVCEKYPSMEPNDLVHKGLQLGLHIINTIGFDEANRIIKQKYDKKENE